LKVLFIIPSITNYHTFLKELTYCLRSDGHQVFLLAGEQTIVKGKSPYPHPEDCEWVKINFPRSFQPQKHLHSSLQIDAQVKKFNPDIIHIHFSAAMFTSALARKKSWPKTIATIHGLAWPSRSKRARLLLKYAELNSAKKMDEVFVLNKEDLQSLNRNGVNNAFLIPGKGIGCNILNFDPKETKAESTKKLRSDLGLKPNDVIFIFIGRQTHFKGFHLVIKAFMRIYHTKSNYKLLLLGDKDRIHSTGLNKTEEALIKIIPAIINISWKENVAKYLALADINVFPSTREGLPVNLMESLSMGVPIITNDSRGCRDVVKNGVNGIVLKENDVESIAEVMKQLAENIVLRNSLSKQALEERKQYDRQNYIQYQINYYKKLIEAV
jgi:glycosyltransferase involved in cell wall biosynthesis